jgi:hypothetical protein
MFGFKHTFDCWNNIVLAGSIPHAIKDAADLRM